jgi:hypothetical protein
LRISDDGTGLGVRTSAASFTARAKSTPARGDTVDGAGMRVAILGIREGLSARKTAVGTVYHDGSSLSVRSGAAALVAVAVSTPAGEDAVNWTGVGVTGLSHAHITTNVAAASSLLDDSPGEGRETTSACLTAGASWSPCRLLAVGGRDNLEASMAVANRRVTRERGFEHGAGHSAVGGSHEDGAMAVLGTTAASVRAQAVAGPFGDDAVDGASLGVA